MTVVIKVHKITSLYGLKMHFFGVQGAVRLAAAFVTD